MRKERKWLIVLLMVAVFLLGVVGCGSSTGEQSPPKANESGNATEPIKENTKTNFPVILEDGAGRSVTIEQEPTHIVSLIPSNTEIAYALGVGDHIIAVTDNDNYPEEVLNKEKVGGWELDLEKIIALNPDLVLANIYQKNGVVDVVAKLEEANIKVVVIDDATSFETTYDTIRMIGKAIGKLDLAEKLIDEMQLRILAITAKAKSIPEQDKKRIWAEFSGAPEIFTAGNGTFMNEMIEMIGAINVVGDQDGWLMLTEEEIVSLNPDVILVNYNYIDNAVELVKARTGWASVPAIANDQVYLLNEDLVSRPGPRLVDGLQQLAEVIYPNIYK